MIDLSPQPSASPFDAVPSILCWGSPPPPDGLVATITIPTYNRSHLLPLAIESALEQDTDQPFWIIITDNASEQHHQRAVLDWLETRAPANLSYYVNAENMGLFPNWNRGPMLATSRWVSILNDDDLLCPSFLTDALHHAQASNTPALITRVRSFDTRAANPESSVVSKISGKSRNPLRDLMKYRGRPLYRASVRDLFWGNELGNSLGLLIECDLLRDLGGFVAEDTPTADYAFYVRLALHGQILQLNKVDALLRIEENFSMRPDTLCGIVRQDHLLRKAILKAGLVPERWSRYLPLLVAEQVAIIRSVWGVTLDQADIAASLDVECVRYKAWHLKALRLRYRGF